MLHLLNFPSCSSLIEIPNMGPHAEPLLHAASFDENLSISTHLKFLSIIFG